MTDYLNTGDIGQPNGTAVTVANSAAGGDAWTVAPVVGAGSITVATAVVEGSAAESYAFTPASAAACYLQWSALAGASPACAVADYVYVTAYPSSTQILYNVRSGGTGTSIVSVNCSLAGIVGATNDVASNSIGVTATALPLNAWTRVEFQINSATTTTGTFNLDLFVDNSASPISGTNINGSALNLGSSTLGTLRVGRISAAGTMAVHYRQNIRMRTGSNTAFGPMTSPPVGSFPVPTVYGRSLTVVGSASGGSGSGYTYSWNFGDGSAPVVTQTANHQYGTVGTFTITLTVKDSANATATTSRTVTTVAAVAEPYLAGVTSAAAWTPHPSGTVLAVLSDTDKTTFISTDGLTSPTNVPLEGFFAPTIPPVSGQPFGVTLGVDRLGPTGTVDATLYDYDGTTIISVLTAVPIQLFTDTSDGGPAGTGNGTAGTVNRMAELAFPWSDVAAMSAMGWDKPGIKMKYTGT